MEKQDKRSFSEKKLDSAFDRLLLEENEMFNEKIMQAMASHVFASTLPGSSYSRKEKELLRRLTGGSAGNELPLLPQRNPAAARTGSYRNHPVLQNAAGRKSFAACDRFTRTGKAGTCRSCA
jgi:hypothetical protein